jgi:hypothetical protein
MARETREQKAIRLIAEQRVRVTTLASDRAVAEVRGESGDYRVTLDGRWRCTCAHGELSRGLCSHALAVQTIYRAVAAALGGEHSE